MDENERDALLRHVGPEQMVDLIAYAEMRALVCAGLGVPTLTPDALARTAVVAVLRRPPSMLGVPRHGLADQMREHVRAVTTQAMTARARVIAVERGLGAPLSPAQLGSLDGIELMAHVGGEQAGVIREFDDTTLRTAAELVGLAQILLTRG